MSYFKAKMYQIRYSAPNSRRGSYSAPHWRAYSALPGLLSVFEGPLIGERGERSGEEGKGERIKGKWSGREQKVAPSNLSVWIRHWRRRGGEGRGQS